MESVDIHECLQEAIISVEQIITDRGGRVVKNFQADNAVVQGDRMHITNTFFNLLDNAVKYCTKAPEIILSTKNAGNGILVTVADNGIGIPEKYVRRIFDRFFRISTGDVHDVKGFGLGLYYVQHVVKDHHGKIALQSEPGRGTTITLTFPQK